LSHLSDPFIDNNPLPQYILSQYIATMFTAEVKKGSAALLVLALVEERPRHGYEISKLIEARSGGSLSFRVASLYPMLYRLERRGWVEGRWVEKAGQRRRRYYKLTRQGRRVLSRQRSLWQQFMSALDRVANLSQA
jgi:PadR family transcriptional regulator, regulatory protein PadR